MITTLDKHTCKRGDRVWEIGTTGKQYQPTASWVYSMAASKRLTNENRCWKLYENCQKECDRLNQIKQ